MDAALVFFVGQLFLFVITSAQCPQECSECKVITDGDNKGTWYLKTEVTTVCENSCLYHSDGKEMCFCDPGPITYETCDTKKSWLVVTAGDDDYNEHLLSSSEIITYTGVCSSNNIPPLTNGTTGGQSAWLGGKLMFCGGSNKLVLELSGKTSDDDNWGATNECFKLTPSHTVWDLNPDNYMKVPRGWFSLSVLASGELIAAGGHDGDGNVLDSLEKYSNSPEKWTLLTSVTLTTPTYGHCAVHYKSGPASYLMIIGGSTSIDQWWTSLTGLVTLINLTTNTKASVSLGPMPASWGPACTVEEDDIFVSGGAILGIPGSLDPYIPSSEVYKYSISTGLFTLQGNLNKGRWGHTMGVTQQGQMVVAGGYSVFENVGSSIENSQDDGQTWQTRTTGLTEGRDFAAMTNVPEGTFTCGP